MSERVVLSMKWGTLYNARYVNVLYNAVRDHIDGPFRFVCLTDEPDGLASGIETHPIPDLGLPQERWNHGAWPKLAVFARDLFGLQGRLLFIDLDSVIVDRLDPFFEAGGAFRAIGGGSGWRRGAAWTDPPRLLSGVFSMDFGAHPDVLDAFMADKEAAYDRAENEQHFIEQTISSWEPWPDGWVLSFKYHLRRSIGADLIKPVYDPPPGAKIVAFHGNPRPIDLVGRKRLWSEPPHSVRCPVTWLDDYWESYGE
ncbi:glycosyltransferase [Alphaproteobacteria bacterium GH1-50]|uniref:Glycosyltransferase n=1 Tax=Kangsaoukella pontilimi TaxID=2691042 RepID=A0A7C9IFY9_9RHOB|nr:glycosyltransferase [Kangsaoukella pontilimi]MXQ06462.1 glycosyltransferase [Kangsaoukella pontilimi]